MLMCMLLLLLNCTLNLRLLNSLKSVWMVLTCWFNGNFPKIKFFKEVDFIISVHELWEYFSIISQIIDQVLESFAISIQENFVINFF